MRQFVQTTNREWLPVDCISSFKIITNGDREIHTKQNHRHVVRAADWAVAAEETSTGWAVEGELCQAEPNIVGMVAAEGGTFLLYPGQKGDEQVAYAYERVLAWAMRSDGELMSVVAGGMEPAAARAIMYPNGCVTHVEVGDWQTVQAWERWLAADEGDIEATGAD